MMSFLSPAAILTKTTSPTPDNHPRQTGPQGPEPWRVTANDLASVQLTKPQRVGVNMIQLLFRSQMTNIVTHSC